MGTARCTRAPTPPSPTSPTGAATFGLAVHQLSLMLPRCAHQSLRTRGWVFNVLPAVVQAAIPSVLQTCKPPHSGLLYRVLAVNALLKGGLSIVVSYVVVGLKCRAEQHCCAYTVCVTVVSKWRLPAEFGKAAASMTSSSQRVSGHVVT